jgi:hypothetical protein
MVIRWHYGVPADEDMVSFNADTSLVSVVADAILYDPASA